ncbi:MAG: hypothetical protein ABIP51_10245, partial [Bacteroidia bacterium]
QELLKQLFNTFITGIRNNKSIKPRTWLEKKALNYEDLNIGFNSGQFHHRKEEAFKNNYLQIGVLKESDAPVKSPEMTSYTCFGRYGIMFPLKDEQGEITNLYAIRFDMEVEQTDYLNDEGIYPRYPHPFTKKLYITHSILDGATLLQTKLLDNRDAVIALQDGVLKEQHITAIKQLQHLEEIILIH